MHAFHSDTAMQMLARLPNAKDADVPIGAPDVTPHTRNFRKLRAQLLQDGWFKRNPLSEVCACATGIISSSPPRGLDVLAVFILFKAPLCWVS
jgi:hypothetical protein